MKSVLIYIKYDDQKAKQICEDIAVFLKSKKINVFIKDINSKKTKINQVDLAIAIGGDGTFLATVRFLYNNVVSQKQNLAPVLGINTGSLGFLTECMIEEYLSVIEAGLKKGFQIEERTMLSASIENNSKQLSAVVNDVVINRNSIARVLDFDVFYNKEFVSSVKGDGIVISTPTGSTAYSLACGGPIVHPVLSAVILTPISPHTLTNRPLVVSDKGIIEIKITSNVDDVLITLDGQMALPVQNTQIITIKQSPLKLKMVRPYGTTYFNILRNKLSFGLRG